VLSPLLSNRIRNAVAIPLPRSREPRSKLRGF
jgi:hypothetical protein